MRIATCRRLFCSALPPLILLIGLGAASRAQSGAFEIKSEQKSTVTGAELCIAIDTRRPISPDRGAMLAPKGVAPIPFSGTFYPAVAARCDQPDAALPAKWTISDTRELRIRVENKWMCLSARTSVAFIPLIDPFLRAFEAAKPDSPYQYLARDLTPDGKLNEARIRSTPPLIASECGRSDAMDFWVVDGANGSISTVAGGDGTGSYPRRCVAIHGDTKSRPWKFDAGMPITMVPCGDLRAYQRPDRNRHVVWTLTSGMDALPTFVAPDRRAYFSGIDGLPIVGPMGRCLTWDKPSKNVVTSDCDGRTEQNWRREATRIRLGRDGECLAHGVDGAVALAPVARRTRNGTTSSVTRSQIRNG